MNMKRALPRWWMAGSAWTLLAGAANAGESTPTALPTLEIIDETCRAAATKSALSPQLTPPGISVIDQQDLEMRDVDSLYEALRYVSGVTPELRGGGVTRFGFSLAR